MVKSWLENSKALWGLTGSRGLELMLIGMTGDRGLQCRVILLANEHVDK